MKQYFTPSIEDIRVGYECQIQDYKGRWEWTKIKDDQWGDLAELIDNLKIRVPYLTKEQIEKEGWNFDGGQLVSWGIKEFRIDINEYSWYKCTLYPDAHNVIITRYDVNGDDDNQLFNGSCKDINTFRYICKLIK